MYPKPGTNCELFYIYVSADIYNTWLGTQYRLENLTYPAIYNFASTSVTVIQNKFRSFTAVDKYYLRKVVKKGPKLLTWISTGYSKTNVKLVPISTLLMIPHVKTIIWIIFYSYVLVAVIISICLLSCRFALLRKDISSECRLSFKPCSSSILFSTIWILLIRSTS